MRDKWLWTILFALTVGIGGLVSAGVQDNADTQSTDANFVCPITGDELTCSKCCPLN